MLAYGAAPEPKGIYMVVKTLNQTGLRAKSAQTKPLRHDLDIHFNTEERETSRAATPLQLSDPFLPVIPSLTTSNVGMKHRVPLQSCQAEAPSQFLSFDNSAQVAYYSLRRSPSGRRPPFRPDASSKYQDPRSFADKSLGVGSS
ncbi:hypothetical protein E1B28_007967 [Marasmius oreades]|uniref:Uncharacterized protein n=1 Tax=Marasmius oreades TaxID=181124 RepID=A0A9P7UVH4_9AGAR|nr:uncharacterized protein E1B28_007967 [Marasmius oreades]KAG7094366.1 hypothetical protein E1B28_007967 [Marasmius oreades]